MYLEQWETDPLQVKHLFQRKVWHRNTGYVSKALKLEFVTWMTRKREKRYTSLYIYFLEDKPSQNYRNVNVYIFSQIITRFTFAVYEAGDNTIL